VFGASDEVLGVIERRILEVVQRARNETEINAAFDQLQLELQEQINDQVLYARKRLLENVDEKVTRQLKTRDGEIRKHLSEFERNLLLIARAELPEARFHDDDERRFDYERRTYTTEWPLAERKGLAVLPDDRGDARPQGHRRRQGSRVRRCRAIARTTFILQGSAAQATQWFGKAL
jgi:hypothetical protein